MSSFKKLSKSDVTVVPYNANKQWLLDYCPYPTSSDYLTIYKGTNVTGSFSLDDDPVTENQYERLVYSQINQLFYQDYTTSLDTSSLMLSLNNYESASQQRPTSSYFIYNDSKNLITSFPTGSNDSGSIRVLAINQDIYGNKVLPNHFILSSSAYYVTDDGFGNLYDTKSTKKHIGNIFYAHGIGIITDPDYQLMFPLPPIAKNNSGSFLTTDTKVISASLNDYARSGTLDTGSLILSGSITGENYSWATGSNGTVILTTTVPGTYTVYYTIGANIAGSCPVQLRSNKSKIAVNVSITLVPPTTTTTTTLAPTTSTTTTTTTAPSTTTTTTTSTTTTTTTVPPTTTTTTSTTTTTTTAPPTTTTSTTTTTTTEAPTQLIITYAAYGANIRLEANALATLTETIEFQVIKSESHTYDSANCSTGETIPNNLNTSQAATIASGTTFGASADITAIGTLQSTKIDSCLIVWSDTTSINVTSNNTIITSPITGKNYKITNVDMCTPL
jgi:hypothetical protein